MHATIVRFQLVLGLARINYQITIIKNRPEQIRPTRTESQTQINPGVTFWIRYNYRLRIQ